MPRTSRYRGEKAMPVLKRDGGPNGEDTLEETMAKLAKARAYLTAALAAACLALSVFAFASPASAGYDNACSGSDPLMHRWALGQYDTYTHIDLCQRSSDGAVYVAVAMSNTYFARQINVDWQYNDVGLQSDYLALGKDQWGTLQSNVRNWRRISHVSVGLYVNVEGWWENIAWGSPYYF